MRTSLLIRLAVSSGILVAFMIYIGIDTGRVLPFVLGGGFALLVATMIIWSLRHPRA